MQKRWQQLCSENRSSVYRDAVGLPVPRGSTAPETCSVPRLDIMSTTPQAAAHKTATAKSLRPHL